MPPASLFRLVGVLISSMKLIGVESMLKIFDLLGSTPQVVGPLEFTLSLKKELMVLRLLGMT